MDSPKPRKARTPEQIARKERGKGKGNAPCNMPASGIPAGGYVHSPPKGHQPELRSGIRLTGFTSDNQPPSNAPSLAGMAKAERIQRWRERLDGFAMSNHPHAVSALINLLDRDEGRPAQNGTMNVNVLDGLTAAEQRAVAAALAALADGEEEAGAGAGATH